MVRTASGTDSPPTHVVTYVTWEKFSFFSMSPFFGYKIEMILTLT